MKSRKLLALFLAIFMLASLVVPASAEITPDAEDTMNPVVGYSAALVEKKDLTNVPSISTYNAEDVKAAYKIETVADWAKFDSLVTELRSLAGVTVYLANDLDFEEGVASPIGNYAESKSFAGIFDGQGHVIKNVTVRADSTDQVKKGGFALFSSVSATAATETDDAIAGGIYNLIIDASVTYDPTHLADENGTDIESDLTNGSGRNLIPAASLVGVIDSGYGDTATTEASVGSITIQNVMNMADFKYDSYNAGGLIIFVKCCKLTVQNCTNAGNMTQVIHNNDTDSPGNAAGPVDDRGIGGIVGVVGQKNAANTYYVSANFENCRNAGDIYYLWNGTLGGIVGSVLVNNANITRSVTVSNSINNGAVSNADAPRTSWYRVCGIVGFHQNGNALSVSNCLNYGLLSGYNNNGGVFGITDTELINQDTLEANGCFSESGKLDPTYNMSVQYYQLSTATYKNADDADCYSLRLVALHNDIEAYDSFGYEISISYADGDATKTVKASVSNKTTVNTSIAADAGMGATLVSATELGGEYVSAVCITNIPVDCGTLTVTLTPNMTAGETMTEGSAITFTVTPAYN